MKPIRSFGIAAFCLFAALGVWGEDVLSQSYDLTGSLKDVFDDPTNPEHIFLYLQTTDDVRYVAIMCTNQDTRATLRNSIGAKLNLRGRIIGFDDDNVRPFSNLELQTGLSGQFSIAQPPPPDSFDVPPVSTLLHTHPDSISQQGFRRVRGVVQAAWDDTFVLVRTENGKIVDAELRAGSLPTPGTSVELVGLPETTLYNLHLNRAIWRPTDETAGTNDAPVAISAAAIVTDEFGRPRMDISLHGRTLRVKGVVRSLPKAESVRGFLYLEDNGFIIPVNADAASQALADLQIGCTVEATGVCVMDVDVWRPNAVFPRIHGYKLITRGPADIRIHAYPPWLTPARMLVIVGVFLVLIVAALLWNVTLRIKAERRGHELAKEQLLRLESELKIHERTRLAVELHDSIAQNLTGASMEIDTALRGDEPLPEPAARHMGRALRTSDSCRGELRNCLWDLRNQALEKDDMNEAIRLTLRQALGEANLSVRFNVPRSRFTDNSAHAILRIIRELATNAVRHGKATEIKVAGSIEDGVLRFSVRDNGCGFDPDACPGVLDGHFGIQGIRERVASFEGDVLFESTPGKGTRVSVSINAPQTEDKEKI